MKKLLSTLLTLCVLLSLSVMLVSCSCEHTWDEGTITTPATQEADGVKTFTCTACSETKTEPVVFTGLTETDWNAAFDSALFENFTYKEVACTTGSGISVNAETLYKFTKDSAWAKITMAEQSQESYAPDTASANEIRKQLVDSIKALAPYASYEYDAATKTYKATNPILIEALDAPTEDITITFADGKPIEIKYSVSFVQSNINFTATSTVTLSDYGTVVLTPPAQ